MSAVGASMLIGCVLTTACGPKRELDEAVRTVIDDQTVVEVPQPPKLVIVYVLEALGYVD